MWKVGDFKTLKDPVFSEIIWLVTYTQTSLATNDTNVLLKINKFPGNQNTYTYQW